MALSARLLQRQKLQRSAREWLKILREELAKDRPHGLGKDGRPKSIYSPVSADTNASGRLASAGYEIVTNEEGVYEIVFGLPGYIQAIDQGIRGGRFMNQENRKPGGKSPFLQSIKEWIKTKNIQTELSTESLAFAIRRSIFNEGTAPTNIISTVNERFMNEFAEEIADGYMEDLENYIIDNMQILEQKFNK
jgi:hypothetical protein